MLILNLEKQVITTCNHGGIGVAIKRHLRNSKAVKVLEEKSSKQCDILWLKCDKQHFNLDNDVYMCGTYIPPHNSKYLKDNNIDMFSLTENDVIYFQRLGHVTVCGDFNSRIGGTSDSLTENDKFHELLNLPEDYVYDTLPSRRSMDPNTNRYHKPFTNMLWSTNLRIINGRKLGDLTRSVTCYEWNGCSLIIF